MRRNPAASTEAERARVLVLAANPAGTRKLDLAKEVLGIQEALAQSPEKFSVEFVLTASAKDLRRRLLNFRPQYVHFCGHGEGNAGIVLHEETGASRLITAPELGALFGHFKKDLQCVFLNCCLSQPQADAIAQHIKYVIGTSDEIGDKPAIDFAVAFYEAISAQESIPEAFEFGRAAIAGVPDSRILALTPKRRRAAVALRQEAEVLKRWILEDHCRFVLLVPASTLATLAKRGSIRPRSLRASLRIRQELALDNHFKHVVDLSLEAAPVLYEALEEILSSLLSKRHLEVVPDTADLLDSLIEHLARRRTLLCLDHVDALLTVKDGKTVYREGYSTYSVLFRRLAEAGHDTCVLLGGRLKPPELAELEGETAKVREFNLACLDQAPGSAEVGVFKVPENDLVRSPQALHSEPKDHPPRPRPHVPAPPNKTLHKELKPLLNLLLDEESVVFLGPGSATEGTKEGRPYPSLEAIARTILADWRPGEVSGNFRAKLRTVLLEEERLNQKLGDYLSGEPGPSHYYLAVLALALSPKHRMSLFLSTGFDDLLAEAFSKLQSGEAWKAQVLRLGSTSDSKEIREILDKASRQVQRGRPVILKLFGDLSPESPLLDHKAKISDTLGVWLQGWFQRTSIFIGYGFDDKSIEEFFLTTNDRGPAYIVGVEKLPSRLRECRGVHHIEASFGSFIIALLALLKSQDEDIYQTITSLLQHVAPRTLYPDVDSIAARAEIASRAALERAKNRLPHHENLGMESSLIPITRVETQPDLDSFFRDPRHLLAVVGDSGTGKSTLFYQIYQMATGSIPVFYDIHEIEPKGSLAKRLAHDFLCSEHNLENLIKDLDQVLQHNSRRLLILVDGINESRALTPATLKAEIESLARRLPCAVKIAYSCRKVYWDNYIASGEPVPKDLYFGSKEFILERFSPRETEQAFNTYQNFYRFRGTFAALSDEFRQRITDPLMLRMLAEGYQDRQLPSFAPAVLIFDTYLKRFHRMFKGTVLPGFLELLVDSKLQEAESGRPSDQFHANEIRTHPRLSTLIQQQLNAPKLPRDPLVILEDEGVLALLNNDESVYRFTYDRFFEYLLGRALPMRKVGLQRREFFQYLRDQVQKLSQQQFWFMQALKSELIRLNIQDSDGPWSLYDPTTLRLLLEDPDAQVSMFTKDTLRELVFEGGRELLAVLEDACADAASSRLLILDIAPDSPRVLPLLVDVLTAGEKEASRRSCYILANHVSTPEHRESFEASLLRKLTDEPLSEALLSGFIYYCAVLFGEADRTNIDPIPQVSNFLRRAWSRIQTNQNAVGMLTSSLIKVAREEAGQFFGNSKPTAMDYLWTWMTPKVKELSLQILPLLVDPKLPIGEEVLEILLFFSACIRNWDDRKNPRLEHESTYKLEYLIAQWILLQRSRDDFTQFKETLRRFVATGSTRIIEVALSSLEHACLLFFRGQENLLLLRDISETLVEWTESFRETGEGFYWPLGREDPLSLNESPLESAARVAMLDELSPGDGTNPFLEKWITDPDQRHVFFALICAKGLWREKPAKILSTLDLIAKSDDATVAGWLNRILKEIYLVYPRLVEDFFWRNSFGTERIQEIKHRSGIRDPSRVSHNGTPLYKALFLTSPARREKFAEWYRNLLQSASLEDFCAEWVCSFVTELMAEQQ